MKLNQNTHGRPNEGIGYLEKSFTLSHRCGSLFGIGPFENLYNRNLTLGLLFLLLSGCATMSADECLVADWYRLGEQDAREGREPSFLGQRDRACREAGLGADVDAWHHGYQDGLRWFCTVEQGFRYGHSGHMYRRTCPPEKERLFLDGYDLGHGLYSLNQRITRNTRQLDRIERSIQREREQPRVDRERLERLEQDRKNLLDSLRQDEVELAGLRGIAVGRGLAPGF